MKHLRLWLRVAQITLLLAAAAFLLIGCNGDKANIPLKPLFEANINGVPFSKPIVLKAAVEQQTLFIEAVGERNFESFFIRVHGFKGPGVYPFEAAGVVVQRNWMVYTPSPAAGQSYVSFLDPPGPGHIEITAYEPDGLISATFSGRMYLEDLDGPVAQVTGGRIADVPVEHELPSGFSSDFLSAQVNGQDFFGETNAELDHNLITITSIDGGVRAIYLRMPASAGIGHYSVNFGGQGVVAYEDTQIGLLAATGGEVTIEAHDPVKRQMKGRLHFTTGKGVDVDAGEFSVHY